MIPSLQSDMYIRGLLPASALLGVFFDAGVMRSAQNALDEKRVVNALSVGDARLDKVCSVGISLR